MYEVYPSISTAGCDAARRALPVESFSAQTPPRPHVLMLRAAVEGQKSFSIWRGPCQKGSFLTENRTPISTDRSESEDLVTRSHTNRYTIKNGYILFFASKCTVSIRTLGQKPRPPHTRQLVRTQVIVEPGSSHTFTRTADLYPKMNSPANFEDVEDRDGESHKESCASTS